ncbi:hypothetical protein GCM10020220_115540 [Nonomuraea rubra]
MHGGRRADPCDQELTGQAWPTCHTAARAAGLPVAGVSRAHALRTHSGRPQPLVDESCTGCGCWCFALGFALDDHGCARCEALACAAVVLIGVQMVNLGHIRMCTGTA